MKFAIPSLVTIFCISLVSTGCGPSATTENAKPTTESAAHDHDHDHPESLKDAVQTLSDLYAKIKPAFESNDPEAAHDALHDVAHLLDEGFPELIKNDSSLTEESKSTMTSTISKLFDEFSKLDGVLHDGPEVEFGTVDSSISSALEELKVLIP